MHEYESARLPDAVSLGFRRLDDLTGGFRPGQVWVVTSRPGHGRTTLLVQWAAALAMEHGWPTWLATPRDDGLAIASRLLALTAKVPVGDLLRHSQPAHNEPRLTKAKRRLSDARLSVDVEPTASSTPLVSPYASHQIPRGSPAALVVDDADLTDWCTPDWALQSARQGALVIVSLPRDQVVEYPGEGSDLLPQWARAADVMLEVRSGALVRGGPDVGEALLTVLKHRHGPTRVARVAFQGHYARFVDLKD